MDIAKLKELTAKATPGRWRRLFGERTVYDVMEDGCNGMPIVRSDSSPPMPQAAANLDFIAAARTAVPELIALVERQEAELAEARRVVESSKAGTFHADIKRMVDRFLGWPLPESVQSDGCVTNPSYPYPRCGTNLLTAPEAEAMFRYVLEAPAETVTLANAGPVPGDMPMDRLIAALPLPVYEPTNKESLTVAADVPGRPVTVDSPEFWALANKWSSPDQFKSRTERGAELVAYIDAHTERAVAAALEGQLTEMGPGGALYQPQEWPDAWHALRDDVLSGVDGLDNDQVNIVLGMLDNYEPEAAPQQHAQAAQLIADGLPTSYLEMTLDELLERYWNIAFSEGQDGVSRGSEAQEVLSAIMAVGGNAQVAQPEQIEIEGCGSMTDEDDGVLTLRFVSEQAAQQFMMTHVPTVDCRDMPRPQMKEDAQAALSFDQIEELMPENDGNNGAFPCEKCGWIQVSAQWLHDFARNVHTAQPTENAAVQSLTDAERLDARRAMFQAYSECLTNGANMLPQEIADKLLAAASTKGGA